MAALPPLAPMPEASPAPSSSTSPQLPTEASKLGLGFDGGDPVAAGTDGDPVAAGTDGAGRVGSQEIGDGEPHAGKDGGREPQPGKDGGSQPHPGTDGDGGKKPLCNRRKNLKESSVVPTIIKEKSQKVVKSNEKKVVKSNEKKASQKQVAEAKLRSEKSRNNNSASPGVPSPIQLTSSPGVNYLARAATVKKEALRRGNMGRSPSTPQRDLVRAATVKKEALKRGNMGGSPSTPQRPSQNQLGSPSLQDLSPDTRATISQASKPKRNSVNMFNLVLNSLREWNIEDKLFSFTLDNASVNIAMINSLRTNLKNKGFLVLEGKLLHFRCATHVFNLIVQDGLKVIRSIVNNIRESVKYVRSSQSRIEKFVAIIIQEGLPEKHPCPDVSSRWNSTYLMLQTALPLKGAFLSLETQDREYTYAPLNSEWELAESVMKVLEVFYKATNNLSGSKYPTSHLYFYQLWSIKKLLNGEESILNRKFLKKDASGQDFKVASMIEQMQAKFNQYWKETYMSACIPVILDPRYKYDLLEYLLSDFGTEKEAHTWMSEVKKNMEELFSEYNKDFGAGETHRDTATEEVQDDDDPLAGWDRFVKSKRRQSNNELEQYLKEQLTPRKEEIDILHWWKTKSELYPVLSKIARDVLAISASTVPSESAFSTGGRVVSDYRSSLTPTTVEALICLQDWFKAADARKNEEEG